MSSTPSSLVWSIGGAGLVAESPTMRLVVLGYIVPVAENNPDQTLNRILNRIMNIWNFFKHN